MKIPFLDLKSAYDQIRDECDEAYKRVMSSGWYILGREVDAFEQEFAEYCGSKYCVSVANGLEALFLTLMAWDVKAGDEVIVPSNTYIATWLAVSHTGATPVPVEPDKSTYNIDPGFIEQAITGRTKVILPVHLYGQPADMDPILAVAGKHGLRVLQDAAQAHGSRYKARVIGEIEDATAFSFYPSKNLGAFGDAGAVTTDDEATAARLRSLRNYGSVKKYYNEVIGYNSRLDELQAALLRVRLKHLDAWNKERRDLASVYDAGLSGIGDIILPRTAHGAEPVYHVYVIRTEMRDQLEDHLKANGIGTLIHYPLPPHLQKAYAHLGLKRGSQPLAEEIADTCISLPLYPGLGEAGVETMIRHIRSFYEGDGRSR